MATARAPREADPYAVKEHLRAALDERGIALPSLGVDAAWPDLALVELGRVRADVAMRPAEALPQGGPQT